MDLHKEIIHIPQCNCNFKALMRKTISTVFQIPEESCSIGKKWCQSANIPDNYSQYYENLLKITYDKEILLESHKQIELDIPRTFADYSYFSKGPGRVVLSRLLVAFIKYNPELGYVQGMNYIAASLLYHCSESEAFWLFLKLVYEYNLVQNYLPGLPGLSKHCHILEYLMIEYLPDLNDHLTQCGVVVQMYTTEWCLTLFTSLLTLDYSQWFLSKFFKHKWAFFYKFVIEMLERLREKLMGTENTMRIFELLKPLKPNSAKESMNFLKGLETDERLTWLKLVRCANEREINEEVISYLTDNFENLLQIGNNNC